MSSWAGCSYRAGVSLGYSVPWVEVVAIGGFEVLVLVVLIMFAW
jgi:hypothetical protein